MELAWQIRADSTRDDICFLEADRFSYRCFSCEEPLPGQELWDEIVELQEASLDEQFCLEEDIQQLYAELIDAHGNVLASTWGLCDNCRARYLVQWRVADENWMGDAFRNIPYRIKRQSSYFGVTNFFHDEDEFQYLIRPKLLFCRLAHPREVPSIDRYWPLDWIPRESELKPYADRFVRVIPQRINSGLASGNVSHAEVDRMRELKGEGLTYEEIARATGRSTSTVWRKLNDKFNLTLLMRRRVCFGPS